MAEEFNGRIRLGIVNKSKNEFPRYAHDDDSGFDLRVSLDRDINITEEVLEEIVLKPFETRLIHTDLYFDIPFGFEVQVRSRSGLAKNGVIVTNSPGTVDRGYTGEICVLLTNLSDKNYHISQGDRIAQAVLTPVSSSNITRLVEISSIEETERGAGGFGSTGIA